MQFPSSGSTGYPILTSLSGVMPLGHVSLIKGVWFQHKWPTDMPSRSIASLELILIVLAALIWGRHWEGKVIMFRSDNESVVTILYTPNEDLAHLLKCLTFAAAKFNFWFSALHVEGANNIGADLLSRNAQERFLSEVPELQGTPPTLIPDHLPRVLYLQRPDWLSPSWTLLFKDTMQLV